MPFSDVRAVPVVIGCTLVAMGLMALLGEALTGAGGFGGPGDDALIDALFGVPGVLLAGGVALLLWGLTEKPVRKD